MSAPLHPGLRVSQGEGFVLLGAVQNVTLLTVQEARDLAYALDLAAERANGEARLAKQEAPRV